MQNKFILTIALVLTTTRLIANSTIPEPIPTIKSEKEELSSINKSLYEDYLAQGLNHEQILKVARHTFTRLRKIVTDCETSGKINQSTLNTMKRMVRSDNPSITDEQLIQEINKSTKSFCTDVLSVQGPLLVKLEGFLEYVKSRQEN